MIHDMVYLILPFLMVFPATIAFIKWRNVSFRSKLLAFEFFVFFAYFLFSFSFTYIYVSYSYVFKIIDPFFLLFLIQKDISYSISRKKQTRLFILLFVSMLLQFFTHIFWQKVYGYELLSLCVLLFSVYIAFGIGKAYYKTVYIPKISRYLLVAFIMPCLLFDAYIFRFPFVLLIFYICLEERQRELFDYSTRIKNLLVEQTRFEIMMNDISNSIKDFSDKKDAAESYLVSFCHFLSVKGAAIYEWDSDKKYFSCVATAGLYFPLGIGCEKLFTRVDLLREITFKQHIKDDRTIIWKCGHSSKIGILLNHSSDNIEGNLSQEVHSIIMIPLLQESVLLGVLILENKLGSDYLTETDFNMARSFANFAAIILNTSRIAAQKSENLRMSTELNSGNVLQSSLFSYDIPKVAGIDVSFFMLPAKEIGGDYYDFLEKDDKLAVVIGDVSGKGVSAGILVAIMQTYLQNQYKREDDLKKLIVDLNEYLYNKISTGMFVTLLFFEWDSKHGKLHYVSCGHEHILYYHSKKKTIECIRSGGLALMMDSDIYPYIKNNELIVEKGDAIILYTDGVTETFNPAKEIFGLERLMEFFEKAPINRSSVEKLLPQTLLNWRGDDNQTDDTTCMLMQF
jgi:serine phosphatase RsbU (regulator of sigma subunit)